jgi:predicted transcriptional regulator
MGTEALEVERRPRSGVVVSVRLSPDEADALQNIAERGRLTLSQVAREAIRQYLSGGKTTKDPAVTPWMATISGQANLEVVYSFYGTTAQTEGSVLEVAVSSV